jgi:hypothetical protein
LIRSRRCSVANTSSSRLATFFMVYTIVINYTFELIINWHRFCFWKISNSNILYNKRIRRVYFYVSRIYIFKILLFFSLLIIFLFLDRFNMLMLKIKFKNKNILF